MNGIQLGLVVAAGLWTSNARGQSSWLEHGTVEQWNREGNAWQLNATEAGTASLILLPTEVMSDSTGCTIRVRWRQAFSGSNSNFTRLHWLLDSSVWLASGTPTIPAETWSVSDEHGPLSFMHLGETGTDDSIRWFSSGPSGLWDDVIAPLNHAYFADAFDIEMAWSQHAGNDTVHITLAHVYEDGSRSASEWCAQAMHDMPIGIGFSAHFTASNTEAATIEILEYGPHVPDTLPPILQQARWRSEGGLELAFSEPMNASAGQIIQHAGQDSLPLSWLCSPSRKCFALPALAPGSTRRFHLSEFEDLNGQRLTDTTITVYPVKPVAENGDAVIVECMVESPNQGEWMELLNATDRSIDVSQLSVWDGSTNTSKALVPGLGWDGVLEPGKRTVAANQWAPWMAESSPLFATIQPAMTLSNTGETIGLISSAGDVIDQVKFSNDWWHAHGTIGLQKKHPMGCTLEHNWIVLAEESEASPGIPSPLEWPSDTTVELVAESAVALSSGTGMFELNQPLHPDCTPVIKGGWGWGDEQEPEVLFWRIDSLTKHSNWSVTVAGVRGCFNGSPSALTASLDVAKFPTSGDLIFTEIAHDPQGASAAWGMFVELFNPSETEAIELAGCTVNGISLRAFSALPPLDRICIPVPLGRAQGSVAIQNHDGDIIDDVAYSRCWHPQRGQSEAGFSLVRLQPQTGRVHPGAWWAWTTSAETPTGCSPGRADLAESQVPTPPAASAIACGEQDGARIILFTAPVQLDPPWVPLDTLGGKSMEWMNSTEIRAPFDTLCPAANFALDANGVGLNEVRKWESGGAEPFIELANPHATWASTKDLFWTTSTVPFPNDWAPISEETHWFIPPQTAVAFAECPSRIALDGRRALPADLPSLWGSVQLQLAESGNARDAFIFESDMKTPWHTARNSFEKTTWNAHFEDAIWSTSASAGGHTAGSWNSWQLQPSGHLNND
ncbi:MAG: lamin tail domain-containing protein, partial [Flavobacteriales bacterium]